MIHFACMSCFPQLIIFCVIVFDSSAPLTRIPLINGARSSAVPMVSTTSFLYSLFRYFTMWCLTGCLETYDDVQAGSAGKKFGSTMAYWIDVVWTERVYPTRTYITFANHVSCEYHPNSSGYYDFLHGLNPLTSDKEGIKSLPHRKYLNVSFLSRPFSECRCLVQN